jgi:uncharacterized protein
LNPHTKPGRVHTSDVAFTAAVKALQTQKGSRAAYQRLEAAGGWPHLISPDLQAFVEAQSSAFLGTANAAGQPYIQHRGGPAGFLRVLDEHTIAFADFVGNQQFISTGNLAENPKAILFLLDHAQGRRIKVWGEACVCDSDADLLRLLTPAGYPAQAQQAVLLTVTAWSENCSQHLPQLFSADALRQRLAQRDERISDLQAQLLQLKQQLQKLPVNRQP